MNTLQDLDELEKTAVVTAAVSGIIHLYAGYSFSSPLLAAAGAGFFGGVAVFLTGFYRDLVVLASIPFTGSQFYFYYSFYGLSISPLAAVDKSIQFVFLAAATTMLYRRFQEEGDISFFFER